MSVTVCQSPAALFHVESEPGHTLLSLTKVLNTKPEQQQPDQSEIWSMIQSQSPLPTPAAAYVHPLVRRSSSLMSLSSLNMCTEGLGSETGSGDFSEDEGLLINCFENGEETVPKQKKRQQQRGKDESHLTSVNYHCSASRKTATRTFPPPLSSISRRDGSSIQMRTRRQDGRLVMEAVPVASQNYLHARRADGRLLLSFVDSTKTEVEPVHESEKDIEEQQLAEVTEGDLTPPQPLKEIMKYQEVAEDEEEDEEEVEVLDRGTMVEVKVSTQPQQANGSMKVQRSSLFINKFVGGTPTTNQNRWAEPTIEENQKIRSEPSPRRRLAAITTTAAAAAVAASSASASSEMLGKQRALPDNKLLFTSKRWNREEMLHHMRRCSELQRPLFFWEAGCVATSY